MSNYNNQGMSQQGQQMGNDYYNNQSAPQQGQQINNSNFNQSMPQQGQQSGGMNNSYPQQGQQNMGQQNMGQQNMGQQGQQGANGQEDYGDKAVDMIEKKLGLDPRKYRAQNEKFVSITD
jgi:hypothetical protein